MGDEINWIHKYDAAKILGCTPRAMYQFAKEKPQRFHAKLEKIQGNNSTNGRYWLFDEEDLHRKMDSGILYRRFEWSPNEIAEFKDKKYLRMRFPLAMPSRHVSEVTQGDKLKGSLVREATKIKGNNKSVSLQDDRARQTANMVDMLNDMIQKDSDKAKTPAPPEPARADLSHEERLSQVEKFNKAVMQAITSFSVKMEEFQSRIKYLEKIPTNLSDALDERIEKAVAARVGKKVAEVISAYTEPSRPNGAH